MFASSNDHKYFRVSLILTQKFGSSKQYFNGKPVKQCVTDFKTKVWQQARFLRKDNTAIKKVLYHILKKILGL